MARTGRVDKSNTLEAVAEAAGVSVMTVSRVMRGKSNVAIKTRDRVLAAAADIGYVHNQLASSLASSKSAQIGVIIPSLRNIVFPEVLSGITDALDKTGYQAVVGITDYDLDREHELVLSMLAWRPAAMLVANVSHRDETRTALKRAQIPIVELMELTDHPVDMNVGIDQRRAGSDMARHLLERGYRRFAYLGTDHGMDRAAARRYQAFVDRIQASAGEMLLTLTATEPSSIGLGRENIGALLARRSEFEAVYFSNDAVAAGAMMYCLSEGIRIPDDIAFASFGGLEIAQAMPIPITTTRSPRYEMGQTAAQMVLKRLNNENPARLVECRVALVEGASA